MISRLVDWEQLDMIADGFSPEFVEIYREFLAEIPVLLRNLHEATGAQDAVQTARIAHQIKGSAANFGFLAVSEPAVLLELEAKGGSLANAANLLAEAESGFAAAASEVRSHRGF